jgi:hypothetical protein
VQGNIASSEIAGYGGGLYLEHSSATLRDNFIHSNIGSTSELGFGGGLFLIYSPAVLQSNVVERNMASVAKPATCGGLFIADSSATLLENVIIHNIASATDEGWGGGLCILDSAATLQANVIVSNTATLSPTATGLGGGLYVHESGSFTLTNNLVAGNHANTEGSGLWLEGTSDNPISGCLLHTTIADNAASGGSGQGIHVGPYTTLALTNTILAGHSAVGITATANSTVTLEGTLWHDNTADTGGAGTILTGTVNVYGDPAFTWNYHLGPDSAAIDAGVDAGVTVDIDGHPRPLDLGYDIGADEYMPMEYIFLPLVLRQ